MSHKKLTDKEINSSFSENALKMMRKRYLFKNEKGKLETPAEMFRRAAGALADVERRYKHKKDFVNKVKEDFFEVMARQEFTPAGRTLTNAGTPTSVIANCIVLPIRDSMDSIFQTLKEAALLQQSGSGLGFSLDELRPAMTPTIRSRGEASGPVSFLKIYNETFGTIKQQSRHGANMAMMSVNHPDVLDFVRAKVVEGEISNFNISVKVTDEFMKKVEKSPNEKWYCTWKGKKMKPHVVLRHANGNVYGIEELDITVGEMFDEIVDYAWTNGEPGIAFSDEWQRTNPLPGLGELPATNPCGEQALHPYDNCNLGSINLARFVRGGRVDYRRLRFVSGVAVRLLDNVIDGFDFPVEKVNKMARLNRRVGLGIMGFADMLYQLGIKYNSEKGFKTAEKVMSAIQEAADQMSQKLAKEKGPFPNYKKSIFKHGERRNAALTTVAPTGSISMMFDTSSGIEPNFALAFVKQDKDGEKYHYLNKYFEERLKELSVSKSRIVEIKEEITKKGSIQHLKDLPENVRGAFVVAMDISGEDHIKMQAVFQKHVDNSISKTINLPNNATKEDVRQSFVLAWKLHCKSCTVYRDGSRVVQILNLGTGDDLIAPSGFVKKDGKQSLIAAASGSSSHGRSKLSPRVRPEVMVGRTYKMKTGYGNLYITINDDDEGEPFEVFATIGKTGGFFQEQSEAICRLISLSLRAGIEVENVIRNLKGIRGPMPILTSRGTVLSLPDAIARVLEDHVGLNIDEGINITEAVSELSEPAKISVEVSADDLPISGPKAQLADFGAMPGCPDCGSALRISEGCLSCRSCGFNRCG